MEIRTVNQVFQIDYLEDVLSKIYRCGYYRFH